MLQAGFLHPQRSADVSVVDCAEIPARLLNSALLLLPVSRYIPMQKNVVMIVVVLTMILHLSIAGLQGIRKAAGVRESMIRGTAGDGALSGQWTAVGGPECACGGLSPVREVVCPRHRQSGVSPVPHTCGCGFRGLNWFGEAERFSRRHGDMEWESEWGSRIRARFFFEHEHGNGNGDENQHEHAKGETFS